MIETNTFGANPIKLQAVRPGREDRGDQPRRGAARARGGGRGRLRRRLGGPVHRVPASGCPTRSPPRSRPPSGADGRPRGGGRRPVPPRDLLQPERTPARRARREGVRRAGPRLLRPQRAGRDRAGHAGRDDGVGASAGDANVDVVGINCGTGPSGAFDALQAILPHTGKPVVVMPNAGCPGRSAAA